ncbi:MAG: sulfite exporter TauE/SafE family protein [Peptococcaceae bacterium]|nr:sulfite exporter TauE/SafE family protein [Peptococcaceae bacterium]
MHLDLTAAGIAVNVPLLLAIGGLVGALVGSFGYLGGFLTTPLLIILGIPPVTAVASEANHIVAGSWLGVLSHRRMGTIDFKTAGIFVIGGLTGCTIGTELVHYLVQEGIFDLILRYGYTVVLSITAILMLLGTVKSGGTGSAPPKPDKRCWPCFQPLSSREGHNIVHVLVVTGLGVIGGILTGVYGMGGSFIFLPVLLYLFRLPVLVAVGTSLILVFTTSVMATIEHALINQSVDISLALVLFAGWIIGMQFSTVVVKYLPPYAPRVILALAMLFTVVGIWLGYPYGGGMVICDISLP